MLDKNHSHEVKIRINGVEKSYHRNSKKKKGKNRHGTSMEDYQNPERETPIEEDDLPLIIVDETAAAAEKKEEEDFEWVLPKEPVKPENKETTSEKTSYIEDLRQINKPKGKKSLPHSLKKKKLAPPSFSKQLIVSIVMAVGIGTCLGFIILAIMNISSDNPLNPNQPVAGSVSDQAENENTGTAGNSDGQSVTIPALGVAVLQGGALSSMEAANATIDSFKSQGFSAVAVGKDTIYVLVGIGQTVEGMKSLGTMASDKGLETYAKEFAIPERTFNSLNAQDAAVLQEGQSLYKELAATSSSLLQGGTLDSSAVEKMNGHFEKISAVKAEEMTDGPKQWKDLLVGAYQHIQQYQTSKDSSELWGAQQKLLEATAFLYQ
ncbi:hypothetical protein JOC95_002309 [Bacillus tianshenii]|uniref:SPOR domain-containing protein n=1 Tax=Sutcliffiella tianshenii TaxID=1463404 RepID=A0ABS2P0G5_9BACI|nr:hypothetical protein [Bacillus tianshenii]MBM7620456.1 hypothetical protein [Bacillus tianshenii]